MRETLKSEMDMFEGSPTVESDKSQVSEFLAEFNAQPIVAKEPGTVLNPEGLWQAGVRGAKFMGCGAIQDFVPLMGELQTLSKREFVSSGLHGQHPTRQ